MNFRAEKMSLVKHYQVLIINEQSLPVDLRTSQRSHLVSQRALLPESVNYRFNALFI